MRDYKALQDIAEFDHPFRVWPDGSLSDANDYFAPSVYHSETNDIDIDGVGWIALKGFTGQYSYNGAVMHSSEYIGGGLAEYILDNPGVYVVVAVYVLPEDDDTEDDNSEDIAGWAILEYVHYSA